MRIARSLLVVLLAVLLGIGLFAVAGCSSDTSDTTDSDTETTDTADLGLINEGTIVVGSDTAFPPFENAEGDEIVGFDVDLMNAIGDELGVDVEFKTYKFDALITGVQTGTEFDMIASAMTITEERQETIDFSDPYINSNQSLAVTEDSDIASTDDLGSGNSVGVQSGTTGEQWTKDNLEPNGVEVIPYDDVLAAFSALQAGDVDAVVNDLPISQDVVKDETRGLKIAEEIETGEQYGFGFSKESTSLRDAVNEALQAVKDSGEYETIYETWFGAPPMSIP
jgi:ABC-type amino acid transport substrate-binding protein